MIHDWVLESVSGPLAVGLAVEGTVPVWSCTSSSIRAEASIAEPSSPQSVMGHRGTRYEYQVEGSSMLAALRQR
jgi:hypothetical protein